jgi:RimJ/RimL family protein N-acetyltransferase
VYAQPTGTALTQSRQGAKLAKEENSFLLYFLFAPLAIFAIFAFEWSCSSSSQFGAAVPSLKGSWRMPLPRELCTDRLLLRRWRPDDRATFAALNADPRVMEFFPKVLTREESDAIADRIEAHFAEHGFGLWAVEIVGSVPFAGFVGFSIPRFTAHFTPCIEIGWRLAAEFWNQGYSTEGARAALDFAFTHLAADEIVSFTVPANVRSRRVMEKIGMTHDAGGDFDHPSLPESHPLRRHVLYRMGRDRWSRLKKNPNQW